MIIEIKVNTKSNKNEIITAENSYKANLTTAPSNGKANKALIGLLSDYFKVSKSQISIIKGEKSNNKIIKICDTNILVHPNDTNKY